MTPNSRSYLNHWTQPDTIVPAGDSVYTPLIVNYSNLQFLEKSNQENRERVGNPNYKSAPVPTNPLALDRYAYVLNNPIRYNDPSGYCIWDLCILEGIGLVEIILFGTVATATTVMVMPGMPEAFAHSVVDLAEQAGQQVEQSIQALSNLGNRAIIRQRDLLPKSGEFPYVAPKQKGNPVTVPVRGGGFKDKAGNIWRRDKSRHGGEHWDVELPNGDHLNVDDKGKITGGSVK